MVSRIPDALNATFACLAIALLLPATATAGDEGGYCVQYDFPDQGDDWYGGEKAPDPRYDFEGTLSQPFGDGNDFDLGFYPSLDPYGFGPPLTATQSSLYEYTFRHGELPVPDNPPWGGAGNTCSSSLECVDSVYCDGEEYCDPGGHCRSGSPVYCGDGDVCTADACDEAGDTCVHVPITSPVEIQSLALWKITPQSADVGLVWYPQYLSDTYNVYRATSAGLADLACLQSDLVTTSTSDTDPLSAGNLFFYLVSGYGCGGESILGVNSSGQLRANPSPCP